MHAILSWIVLVLVSVTDGFQTSPISSRSRIIIITKLHQTTGDGDGDGDQAEQESPAEIQQPQKSLSPLAMAAADWLAEDEDDELQMYWEKFDDAKRDGTTADGNVVDSDAAGYVNNGTTTEELLDNFYTRQGIDKRTELKYKGDIEVAVKSAKRATSPREAIRLLEAVRPYMQLNSKIGGNALLELGQAYDANEEEEKAREIYEALKSNPQSDIRRRIKQLLASSGRTKKARKNLWDLFNAW